MQTLTWYVRRARSMSPGELVWRARSVVRDASDRVRIPLGLVPSPEALAAERVGDPPFRLSDIVPGAWQASDDPRIARWRERLRARGERVCAHRLDVFDLEDADLGTPPRWNYDLDRGVETPMAYSPSIDYRDYSVTGDCKIVWEPSRHHQLVVLARAYRATGDVRFAREAAAQIESWIDQCPFGRGMQWRSPLELAIRGINWVWAYDLVRESGAFSTRARERLLHALYLHAWDIARKFSQGSSANNHLIGEAAGVFIITTYFADLPNAARWRDESAAILEREIHAQSYEDGGGREQAFGYHGFVLQFLLAAGAMARKRGADFSRAYWTRLERMLEFACSMLEGGPAPMFGDADDGYVLDLGDRPGNPRDLLAIGAAWFGRGDFKAAAEGHDEPVHWFVDAEGVARFKSLPVQPALLASRAFEDTGCYLLQCGHAGDADRISVLFDCGELGFGPIAAHGHADALSVSVRAFGEDLLVDPGTYDYFTYPEWRRYFRSTRAHNTVAIDDAEQSDMLGAFLWGRRANARCTYWDPSPTRPAVAGEHDGYSRLADGVQHHRRVELDSATRAVTIQDDLRGSAVHQAAVSFHISETCQVSVLDARRFLISATRGRAVLTLDPLLEVSAFTGSVEPRAGWVSRGYHRKVPATTIVGTCRVQGAASFVCRLEIGRPS